MQGLLAWLREIDPPIWAAIITGTFTIIVALLARIHRQVNSNFAMQREEIRVLQSALKQALLNNLDAETARLVLQKQAEEAREVLRQEAQLTAVLLAAKDKA